MSENVVRIGFPRMTPCRLIAPNKSGDSATGGVESLPLQLPPDLANVIDAKVLLEDTPYLDLQADIAEGADRQAIHVQSLGDVIVVG